MSTLTTRPTMEHATIYIDLGTVVQQWYFTVTYFNISLSHQAGRFWYRGDRGGKAFLYLGQLAAVEIHVLKHTQPWRALRVPWINKV